MINGSSGQKTPFSVSVNKLVERRITDALNNLGQELPCHIVAIDGAIVTVNFDIQTPGLTFPSVQCTTIGSQYLRLPLQVGDKGVCIAADVRLGGVTGLGAGAVASAPLADPSNLGSLTFLPLGNINWAAVDPNAVVIVAPNGASLSTTDGTSSVIISESQISLTFGGNSVVVNSSGVAITGTLTINGNPYHTHAHTLVQSGTSNSGPVTP